MRKAVVGDKKQHGDDDKDDSADPQKGVQQLVIDPVEPFEERFRLPVEPSLLLRPQDFRAEHRRKRQCAKRRNHDRSYHDRHKFPKEKPGRTAKRKHRNEHGHQHDRRGDDGEEYLVRPGDGCRLRRHLAFNLLVDVFHDDNRVIDDKPYREDHRKQRQHVDRKAEKVEDEKASDNRNRNDDHRDERRADFPQEEEDHGDDEQKRNENRLDDFPDGGADVYRRIHAAQNLDIRRQVPANVLDAPVKLVRNRDMVRTGLRNDGDRDDVLSVSLESGARILRFVVNGRHVRNPDDGTVRRHLDRNRIEVRRLSQASERADGKIHRLPFDLSRGKLLVFP